MTQRFPRLFTVSQAVEAIEHAVSEGTLRREIQAGRLRARRIGRCLRITDFDLEAWIRGEEPPSGPQIA